VTDIFDQAQANDELFRQSALNKHFARKRDIFADGDNPSSYPAPLMTGAGKALRCEDCGGKIGAKRLKANPEATRCIGCQLIFERRPSPRE
jgi:phage/conjugal plasmid C-4 type zinc finger TraR family protein